MKKFLVTTFLGVSFIVNAEVITVYGPSSMKWIGKKYGPIFEKNTGDKIKYVSIDGILGRLKLEKKNPKADVVVGMTDLTVEMAKHQGLILPYIPKNIDKISNENYKMYGDFVVPIDYGYLAINYNKKDIPVPPKNLTELSKLNKKLLLENPLTSITGLESLQWSIALYGENWLEFWKQLKPAIYSVEPGWSEAFAKFTSNEAPMMLGYATSNLFFTGEDSSKYDSFLIENGSFIYQEGASLVNRPDIKAGSKKFMENILSDEFQTLVATKNYMFPVTSVALDKSFNSVPRPKKSIKLTQEQIKILSNNIDSYKRELVDFLRD